MLCCRGHGSKYNLTKYPDEAERKELIAIHIKESKILKENLRLAKQEAIFKINLQKYESAKSAREQGK